MKNNRLSFNFSYVVTIITNLAVEKNIWIFDGILFFELAWNQFMEIDNGSFNIKGIIKGIKKYPFLVDNKYKINKIDENIEKDNLT